MTSESENKKDEGPRPAAAEPESGAGRGAAAAPPFSPEESASLAERAAKADEWQDKYLRSLADLENFRRRAQREKEEAVRYATEAVLERLLPVIDSFEMAMQSVEQAHDPKAVAQGVKMIHNQFHAVLQDLGVEAIEAVPGKPFDHSVHEAVGTQESAEHPEGAVISQMRRGYKVRGKLVRPAGVWVAQAASGDDKHATTAAPPGAAAE